MTRPLLPPARLRAVLLTGGVVGWAMFAIIAARAYHGSPPGSGFDLELLIAGGRQVASGHSPYAEAMLAGRSVEIATLFYSYPPLVAQAFSLLAWLPSGAIFAVAVAAASVAAVAVAGAVATVARSASAGRAVLLPVAALLPFWFPYTVGMLFGNLDIFFPALYGLVLIPAILPARAEHEDRWVVLGGVALALASVTKLHPAVLGVWFLVRGAAEWRRRDERRPFGPLGLPRSWRVAGVAIVTVAILVAASLIAGGTGPWTEYVSVLRAGASVDLLDTRNLGPAVQLVMFFGLAPSAVAPIQVVILAVALGVTIVAALIVEDPLESLLWAAVASFVVLPVTWFHHFAALIPFGIAALIRADPADRRSRQRLIGLAVATFAIGAIGFGQPPTWLLVPVFLAGARLSRPGGLSRPAPQPLRAGPEPTRS